MKIELTKTGWSETTTKNIKIEQVFSRVFMEVGDVVCYNEKYLPKKNSRYYCAFCRGRWEEMSVLTDVVLILTNDGNKTICSSCCDKLTKSISQTKD